MRLKVDAKYKLVKAFGVLLLLGLFLHIPNKKIEAAIKNTINFQAKITQKDNGLNASVATSPTCIINNSADTCDFRIRIWNVTTGGTATAGNNLLYEELFTDQELGDNNGIVNLTINSVCAASSSGTHAWSSSVTSSTICQLFDDNGDVDSTTGVNFNRNDLYLELTFDPSGTWTSLASPPAIIETFSRTLLKTAPSAFIAQSLNGFTSGDFVQLSPSSIQNTSSSNGAIRINQQGSGSFLQLQQGGVDKLVFDNNGQLQLSTQGSTGGIKFGDSGIIYRSAAGVLTDTVDFSVALNATINGLSNLRGNVRSLITVSNGSTTTTGTGSSTRNLTLTSTTNFDIGNIVYINSSTYARIDSVDSSTALTVTPAVSWSAGQTVVEYTSPTIGGDGTVLSQQFDSAFVTEYVRAGADTLGTTYGDKSINGARGLKIETGNASIDSTNININTSSGLVINKNEYTNVTATWSTGKTGGTPRAHGLTALYQGKMYIWSGSLPGQILTNTMDIYDINSNSWSTGASGGSGRAAAASQIYNGKWYIWGGCDNNACSTYSNVMDIYDFASNSWSTGTSGGTARAAITAVLRQGSIYFASGCNGASCSSTSTVLDVYNIASNSWSTGTAGGAVRISGVGVLYNDKMYTWSGLNGSFVSSNTMDVYDFKTRVWSTGTTGGTVRYYANAVVFENKMYAWAGQSAGTLNTMDIYDFAKDVWTTGVTGGTARNRFYTVLYGGKMYNWGGVIDTGSVNMINTMDVYDFGSNNSVLKIRVGDYEKLNLNQDNVLTITNQALGLNYPLRDAGQYTTVGWSTATSSSDLRMYGTGVTYNGKFYYANGCLSGTGCANIATNILIYNPTTDTYSTSSTGGTPKWIPAVQQYNGKIYMLQGSTNTAGTTFTTGVDIYDIASDTWSTGTSGGTGRFGVASALFNGKIYIWGGNSGSIINTLDIYDIKANSWSTGLAGGTARWLHSGVLYNGRIYFWGGLNASSTLINTLDIYDIQTNTWIVGTAGGTAVRSITGVVYNGKMYLWGGFNVSSVAVNTMSVYDFVLGTWSSSTTLNGGTARFNYMVTFYNGKAYYFGGATTGNPVGNMEIFNFGSSNSEDVFYISNNNEAGSDNGKLFRFDAAGRAYTNKQGGWFSVGADYAEYMHVNDQSIVAGDIVKLDKNDAKSLIKTDRINDPDVVGVISTDPGFVGNIQNIEDINNNNPNMKLLSMVGQVPVRVSTENGNITSGDRITSSSVAGIGMKANEGDSNIGIAQESYSNEGIGTISVLITRNNDGISNRLQINLGETGKAGFRLSNEGKMQFKDNEGEWSDISRQVELDTSIVWNKIGDNIYNNNSGSVSIGVKDEDLTASKLQISKNIEAKDGLKFVKLSAEGTILIGGYKNELGFRLNNENGTLEYKDILSKDWKGMNGILVSRMQVNADGTVIQIANARQLSGWGYVKGDGEINLLNKEINLGSNVDHLLVFSNIIGSSELEPKIQTDCNNTVESDVTSKVTILAPNKFNLSINDPDNSIPERYVCFNWLAVGNN